MQKKTVWIAGWLFADLLLGLAMLFIVSMAGLPAPMPTWTATPTKTATLSPTPTNTGTPTMTPTVRGTPGVGGTSVAPTPTLATGLNPTPVTITFRADPNLVPAWLTSPNSGSWMAARAQLRTQVRECFSKFDGVSQAGMVYSVGGNPKPENGNQLATEVNGILREEFPRVFTKTNTAYKDLHMISTNPSDNGAIYVEVFFVASREYPTNVIERFGNTCTPPPVWCQGSGALQVNVYNWLGPNSVLYFNLGGRSYEIKSTEGPNPIFQCVLVGPGAQRWTASSTYRDYYAEGSVQGGQSLSFCIENQNLVSNCRGASPPPALSGAPTPTPTPAGIGR